MLTSIYRSVAGPLEVGAWWLAGPLLIALMLAPSTWAQDGVAGRPVESAGTGRVAVNGGTVRIEGRVERAIHAPLDLTFRVIASGPTGSWDPVSLYPDEAGRFELFVPEGTPHVSFAIDGEYEVGLGGSWWSGKEPHPVVLKSGLKTQVRLRSVRSDGTPVEGVRFAYPPQRGYQRRWSIPGVSDGQGNATVWLDGRWASGLTDGAGNTVRTANFHGVSPGGLVAAVAVEFGKSQEEGNAQTVVFQEPARVRLTFRKLFEQGEGGAFPVEWRGWPALLAGEHELSPVQELSVGDWETSDPEGFARGKYDFAIVPGVEHHLRFVTAEDWHWKHDLPPLQPGELHVLNPVVLDPGAVVRGKV
ncbi:MAG: hypothetical protein P1V35_07855, partial [Planctomycetota bacterium]|nr:hypothetical protein [Planctomycetota bacterium]